MIDPDTTLLLMGLTAPTPWERDQIHRLCAQARSRGITLVGADTPAALRSATAGELANVDDVLALDIHNPEPCRAWAATEPPVDGVLTVREPAVLPAAVIARELGLPGNDPDAVRRVRTRDLCRQRLRDAGLPQPYSAVCEDADDAERFLRETLPGPWIVAPRDGLDGAGVSRVDRLDQLPEAVRRAKAPDDAPYVLVETFVPGGAYSAEGVMLEEEAHVLALTHRTVTDGLLTTARAQPSGLDPVTAERAAGTVAEALGVLGVTHGLFHVGFWVNGSGIVIGDVHCRAGGEFVHALVEQTRPGLELFGLLVDDLLDCERRPLPEPAGAARADFLLAPPGRLRAVHGWEELLRHPNVLTAALTVEPGGTVTEERDDAARPGVFVTRAAAPDGLEALAARLARRIVLDVEDAEDPEDVAGAEGVEEAEHAEATEDAEVMDEAGDGAGGGTDGGECGGGAEDAGVTERDEAPASDGGGTAPDAVPADGVPGAEPEHGTGPAPDAATANGSAAGPQDELPAAPGPETPPGPGPQPEAGPGHQPEAAPGAGPGDVGDAAVPVHA
ncbi:hypothetical protein [Streptomyces caatingaensis]|uniref:hypothetical protein n=1 Tax=Streptomyces caatingaensis TaxID=1678637 RepID=UPI0006727325|nr:hypothetical protein [Streptomyces caatingaensis]